MKPIILSTGMSTLSNIEDAINTILKAGNPNIILLHCNSSYPAPEEEMNLSVIETLKNTFNLPVGCQIIHLDYSYLTQLILEQMS